MRLILFNLLFSCAFPAHVDASISPETIYRKERSAPSDYLLAEHPSDVIGQENKRDLSQAGSAARFQREEPPPHCVQGDIIFILDSSGSIGKDNWQLVRNFVSEAVGRMNIGPHGTHVGVVTFGNRGHIIFNLNKYTTIGDIQAAIAVLPFLDQNTNTSGGLWMAKDIMFTPENGDRPEAQNIAIVITDGESTYDHHLTIPYAEKMKASGIIVISIGIGNNVTTEELNGMASPDAHGKPQVYQVGSYALLATLQDKLSKVACEVDTVSPKTTATATAVSLVLSDSEDGCNQDFGPECPNTCSKSGGSCCWCDKSAQHLGLTQTCSCCPAGYQCCPPSNSDALATCSVLSSVFSSQGSQCCPSKNISRLPKCCPSDSICGPAGSDGCYVIGPKSKSGTVECSNCETYTNPPKDLHSSKKTDVCDTLCKL